MMTVSLTSCETANFTNILYTSPTKYLGLFITNTGQHVATDTKYNPSFSLKVSRMAIPVNDMWLCSSTPSVDPTSCRSFYE
jgi:hypothetical protein